MSYFDLFLHLYAIIASNDLQLCGKFSCSKALSSNSNDYELAWSQILAIVVATIIAPVSLPLLKLLQISQNTICSDSHSLPSGAEQMIIVYSYN